MLYDFVSHVIESWASYGLKTWNARRFGLYQPKSSQRQNWNLSTMELIGPLIGQQERLNFLTVQQIFA